MDSSEAEMECSCSSSKYKYEKNVPAEGRWSLHDRHHLPCTRIENI